MANTNATTTVHRTHSDLHHYPAGTALTAVSQPPTSDAPPSATPAWQQALPRPLSSIPLELLAVCALMTFGGLFVLWPVLESMPSSFKLLGLSGPFFALGLLLFEVWIMLGAFGAICLYVAWRLANADRVARGVAYVLLGAFAAALLVGNVHNTQMTLVLLACLGAVGTLWLSPNVRAFFTGAGAPQGDQPMPVIVARVLLAIWSASLCLQGVLLLPLGALGGAYVPVGLLMLAAGVGGFVMNRRVANGDETARLIVSAGVVLHVVLLLALGRSDPAVLIPVGLALGVAWNLWAPPESQRFFSRSTPST
ncbi:MAG TPA: hypothetical protein VNX67_01110 [Solirubrobacteraceae bacterium]|jgi:hypothetical protein|nr:hypothetical protein [Solirubrobacteraceae bacterium]